MNSIGRILLLSSACVVVFVAVVAFGIILWKVRIKKREIRESQLKIAKELENKESEQKMFAREDFGKEDKELQNILGNTINHEIVEFCINSSIRNEYKKLALIGNVEPYEAIILSNKTSNKVLVKRNEFDVAKYDKIKDSSSVVNHDVEVVDSFDGKEFDSIMCLNSTNNYETLFLNNEKYLRNGGMFVFANTKSNRSSVKSLVREVEYLGYRYDVLKWYTGFVTIVK